MPGIVYSRADRRNLHAAVGIRGQKISHLDSSAFFIKPAAVIAGYDNNRHSIMNRRYFFIGSRGYNRAGINRFLVMLPLFP